MKDLNGLKADIHATHPTYRHILHGGSSGRASRMASSKCGSSNATALSVSIASKLSAASSPVHPTNASAKERAYSWRWNTLARTRLDGSCANIAHSFCNIALSISTGLGGNTRGNHNVAESADLNQMLRHSRRAVAGITRCSVAVEQNNASRSWRGRTSAFARGNGKIRNSPPSPGAQEGFRYNRQVIERSENEDEVS